MNALPAGRELDVRVAPLVGASESWRYQNRIPRYSTDIVAAWLVVEYMRADGWFFSLNNCAGGWTAWFVRVDGDREHRAVAERSAPLAICHAALAAIGGTE